MTSPKRDGIYALISAERERQEAKYPGATIAADIGDFVKSAVIQEEAGEIARAIIGRVFPNPSKPDNLEEELVQLAACCVGWLESLGPTAMTENASTLTENDWLRENGFKERERAEAALTNLAASEDQRVMAEQHMYVLAACVEEDRAKLRASEETVREYAEAVVAWHIAYCHTSDPDGYPDGQETLYKAGCRLSDLALTPPNGARALAKLRERIQDLLLPGNLIGGMVSPRDLAAALSERSTIPAVHSCDAEMRADPTGWCFSGDRLTGDAWKCSCGKSYLHICDPDACSWFLDEAEHDAT